MVGAVGSGGSAVLRSTSLSSGYRVANLAETAGEVAAWEVVSQAVVDRTLAQAQAAHTGCVERSAVGSA